MRRNRSVILWVCAAFGIGVLVATFPRAELGFKGDLELLKMTARAQRDNVQRISTWQGSSLVEESSEDAQGPTIREQSMFHFVFSREHEATRWEWKGQSRYVRPGLTVGGRLVDPNWWSSWANEMRKGDTFYKYELGRITKEGQKAGTLVIWPSQQAETGAYSYSFDPMWYLKGRVTAGADDLADLLMEYYEQSSDQSFRESDRTLKASRDADLVIFETRGENVLNRFVFDLSKGGSPIKVLIESSMGTQTREWTYEQRGDVWIPKSFTYTSEWLQPQPNGETKLTRKVTFTENVLNRPVAVTEFSLDKLGLKVGDLVSDHKLGLRYQYGGMLEEAALQAGNLPEDKPAAGIQSDAEDDALMSDRSPAAEASSKDARPEQEKAQPALINAGRSSIVWPIVLLAILAVGGIGFVLLRRRWKTRAAS